MSSEPGTFNLATALVYILRERGPLGLFRGFGAQWGRFGPYAITQYFIWERLRGLLGMQPL